MKKSICILILIILLSTVASAAGVVANNSKATKKVAITFDDGPHPKFTDQILDILKDNNVKATFFVLGVNAKQYPDKVKRIFDEGHEIGNHTYNHVFINKVSDEKLKEEILKTDEVIKEITGVKPIVFRPPGGAYNDKKVEIVNSTGHSCILWSWWQDTRDWTCPSVENVVSTVINNIHDGDIILFHDFNSEKTPTPRALKIIIPQLIDMGYEFVSVSELIV